MLVQIEEGEEVVDEEEAAKELVRQMLPSRRQPRHACGAVT